MSDAKKAPKKSAPKKTADHPKYSDMVASAIASLKERNGSSRQAIVKYIKANYKVSDSADVHIKLALKRGVSGGALLQVKGTGASGSFKVIKAEKPKPKQPKKKVTTTKKVAQSKPKAKKAAKSTTPKKKTATKKKNPGSAKKTGKAKPKTKTPSKKTNKKKPSVAKKPKSKPKSK